MIVSDCLVPRYFIGRLDIQKPSEKEGVVSPAVGDLRALVTLHMDFHEGNRIHGVLPPELGECIHLEELILNGHKHLTGEIPNTFAKLTKLRIVHLDENQAFPFSRKHTVITSVSQLTMQDILLTLPF